MVGVYPVLSQYKKSMLCLLYLKHCHKLDFPKIHFLAGALDKILGKKKEKICEKVRQKEYSV